VSFQQVIIEGNLGQDPDVKVTSSGTKYATLSVATSESWKDKTSGERKEKVEWHRVVVWVEHMVKFADEKLRKGDTVLIVGKLRTRKWQDQDGKDRYSTEIVVQGYGTDLQGIRVKALAGGRRDEGDPGPEDERSSGSSGFGSPARTRTKDEMDDEIPF
jgi:single-strand DNA-binding protein